MVCRSCPVEPEATLVLERLAPFLSGASGAAAVDDAFGVGSAGVDSILFSQAIEADGALVFAKACELV
jgi:hypothetical protein